MGIRLPSTSESSMAVHGGDDDEYPRYVGGARRYNLFLFFLLSSPSGVFVHPGFIVVLFLGRLR